MNPGGEAADWYYSITGQPVGPVALTTLRMFVAQGVVQPEHFVRHEGWDTWWSVLDAAETLGVSVGQPSAAVGPALAPRAPVTTGLPTPHAAAVTSASPSAIGTTVTVGQRIASWAIDAVVLLVALFILNLIPGTASVFATLLTVAFYVAYTVGLPWRGADTVGHLVTGTSLRDAETGEALDVVALAARSALVVLLAMPLLLGLIGSVVGAVAHPQARAWHDAATGSVMVKRR